MPAHINKHREPGGTTRRPALGKWPTLLGLLVPINLLLTLDRAVIILVAPLVMVKLGLTLVETTLLTSVVLWTYSVLQIPAGWVISRFGVRRTMAVALFIWSTAMVLTPLTSSFAGLLVLRVLLGVGQAPDWAASISTVKTMFDPAQRARASGLLLSSMYLGTALGAPLTAALVVFSDWHLPFYLCGGAGLVVTVLWLIFFEDGHTPVESTAGDKKTGFVESLAFLARSPQFWSIGACYVCLLSVQSVILMAPLFLTSKLNADVVTLGWMTGGPAILKYVSVLLAGVLADVLLRRTGSVWLARTPMLGLGCLVAGCSAAAAAWVPGGMLTVAMLCLCSFALGFAQVSLWCSVQDLTVMHTGTLTGFTTACGNFAYASVPMIIAFIVDRGFGWEAGFTLFLVAGVAGALLSLVNRPQNPIESSTSVSS